MVGFGSSLRMSRRRGWEDAYLDYASLRLLLTQIEAVYEEEDWKRGGTATNTTATAHDDEEWGRWNLSTQDTEEEGGGATTMFWNMFRFRKSHRRKRKVQVGLRSQTRRGWEEEPDGGGEESESNWVVAANDGGGSSPRRREKKKDKASHALDKRGWRSPGVTDYRDELFLVSDDDIAFGYGEEDDDDWEDTDAEDSDDEILDEYEGIRVDSSSSDYDNLNYETNNYGQTTTAYDDDKLQTLSEEQRSQSAGSVSGTDLRMDEDDNDQQLVGHSRHNSMGQSSHPSPDTNLDEIHGPSGDLDRVDHPETPVNTGNTGVLQSRYETFASVAARRGVGNTEITSGSPEQSWLDFIPDFLGKKSKPKAKDSKLPSLKEKEALASPKTSPALAFAESLSPPKSHHSPVLSDSTLKFRYEDQPSHLFGPSESDEPVTPNSLYTSHFNYKPATATALGASMPETPLSLSPVVERSTMERKQTGGSGFGVSLNSSLLPSNETTGLLTSSSSFKVYGQQNQQSMTPTRDNRRTRNATGGNVSQYQFYSFQDNHEQSDEQDETNENLVTGQNMFSYYNDGYFSVRSQNNQQQRGDNMNHLRLPSLSTVPEQAGRTESTANFIMNFLLGKAEESDAAAAQRNMTKASSRRKRKASKRRRERMRRQRQLQRRRELVPDNLRVAHMRASAITERFRGLLQAEVYKIILFANTRLGELSDTIGSLRYSSYEEGNQDVRRTFPNLDDGGIHPCSSSDDDEGDTISCASSDEDNQHHMQVHFDQSDREHKRHHRHQSDSSNEKDAATKRQLAVRDRFRIGRPLFQKAGFLGEDFSLLSAVDEADAYTAIGVELMHLLKFVCVNIIAVRKICKKHDRLLANRMLGDFYHQQIKQIFDTRPKNARHEHIQAPQFGLLLSKPAGLESTGGYTLGIFDSKIQEIANSTTMQTVSSSLAVALAEAEASQSRSIQLRLNNELGTTLENRSAIDESEARATPEIPSPKQSPFAPKRLRDAVSYQIGGHCFRADDESSVGTPPTEEDEHARDISLTRLQYVVTSVFGLREAARNRSTVFEHHASRLFMASTGPNIVGDGLTGCARETLDFLCSYNPDKAYLLDADSLYSSLRIGREKAMGLVMTSALTAASNREATSLAISRSAAGNAQDIPSSDGSLGCQHILRLNTVSMVLFIANYYVVMPSGYMFALELDTRSSQSLLSAVANISSLIACCIHAMLLSKRYSFVKSHIDLSFFRAPLIVAALFSILGNVLYSYSVTQKSFHMALMGRFLFGFGSCELLNRHLLGVALPNDSINSQIALLVKRSLAAAPAGLLFGSVFDLRVKDEVVHFLDPVAVHTIHLGASNVQNHSSIANQTIPFSDPSVSLSPPANMSELALNSSGPVLPGAIQNSSLVHQDINSTIADVLPRPINKSTVSSGDVYLPPLPLPSNSLQVHLPFGEHRLVSVGNIGYVFAVLWFLHLIGLVLFYDVPKRSALQGGSPYENQTIMEQSNKDDDMDAFDDSDDNVFATENALVDDSRHGDETLDGTYEKLQTMSRRSVNCGSKRTFIESIGNVWRLVLSNVAFPTTAAILFLAKATMEVLLCSSSTILSRYFAWSGALAGLFMGAVTSSVLPINVLLSEEKNLVERGVIKGALRAAKYAILFMINYEAVFLLIRNIIKNEKKWVMPSIYDDVFGILQYIIGFCVVFVSVAFLESATLTLMSKVSPVHLKRYSMDNSFIVIVLSLLGRLVGDFLISAVDVSSWVFCSDIINSLLVPLLIGFVAGEYLVRKHYFFLI